MMEYIVNNKRVKIDSDDMPEMTMYFNDKLEASYNDLVKILGEPNVEDVDDDKITCEWFLNVTMYSNDGTDEVEEIMYCNVYDWKEEISPVQEKNRKIGFHLASATKAKSSILQEVLQEILIQFA